MTKLLRPRVKRYHGRPSRMPGWAWAALAALILVDVVVVVLKMNGQ